jgi:hypothetical protein
MNSPVKGGLVTVFFRAKLALTSYLSSKSQHLRHIKELITPASISLRSTIFFSPSSFFSLVKKE